MFLFLSCFLSLIYIAYANPQQAFVQAGEASLREQKDLLEIDVSDGTILDWASFSIEAQETTRFYQPSEQAVVLNQVIGSEVSQILGRLEANGRVYLSNPHGILIGKEGRIDTASFLATTFQVPKEAFLAKQDFLLQGESKASIIHQGVIQTTCGPVFLLAKHIENQGEIQASDVAIGAARQFFLQREEEGDLWLKTEARSFLSEQIEQEGISSLVIQKRENRQATQVVEAEGRVFLCSEGDIRLEENTSLQGKEIQIQAGKTLHSSGIHKAEQITFTAETIELIGSKLTAWKEEGGGNIFLGGGIQGKDPLVPPAKNTWVDKESILCADAAQQGKGGTIVVWGEKKTQFLGEASAKGGIEGGEGGFIEISSPGFLVFEPKKITTQAFQGKSGMLLLDPADIVITSSTDSGYSGGCPNYSPTANTMNISTTTLQTCLNGSDVTLSTTASGLAGSGNITCSATTLSWNSSHSLTLEAERAITISGSGGLECTGSGSIILKATGISSGNYIGVLIDSSVKAIGGGGITIQGTGGDSGSTNRGISVEGGILWVGDSGTISLEGTGGGSSATDPGSANIGVYISGASFQANSLTIKGTGGVGTGGSHDGVLITTPASISNFTGTNTSLSFSDCTGGTGGNNNYGVNFTAGTFAPEEITFTACEGGTGESNNSGINIIGGTLGSNSNTNGIGMTGIGGGKQVGGATSSNHGIIFYQGGVVRTKNTGSISLTGTGGGNLVNPGIENIGILLVGPGVNFETNSLTFGGTGGEGVNGSHKGVYIASTAPSFNFTGTSSSLAFSNCYGGDSELNNSSNIGVQIEGGTYTVDTISFTNCQGGTAAINNYGVFLGTGVQLNATSINALTGIQGGAGTNNNYGFYINGATLGSTTSDTDITISASSSGTGEDNVGIYIDNSSNLLTQNGSISLTGTPAAGTTYGIQIDNTPTMQSTGTTAGTPGGLSLTSPASIYFAGIATSDAASFTAQAGVGLSITSSITSSTGDINLGTTNADISIGDGATIRSQDGALSFISGDNITSSTTSTMETTGSGNINFQAQNIIALGASSLSLSGGDLTVTAGGNLILNTDLSTTANGSITLQGGNILLQSGSSISSVNGDVLLIAGGDITATDVATLTSTGSGNYFLVVDNLYASSPSIGPGVFSIPSVSISTLSGFVALYAGEKESANHFPSSINGSAVPGGREIEGFWYPQGSSYWGYPFYIFYKGEPATSTSSYTQEVQQVLEALVTATNTTPDKNQEGDEGNVEEIQSSSSSVTNPSPCQGG